LIVGGNIFQIINYSVIPHVELNYNFSMMIVAIIGATFSPYLFFWQTSEEAEEEVAQNKIKEISEINRNSIKNKKNRKNFTNRKIKDYEINNVPKATKEEIRLMRMDIVAGMTFVQIISWSIIITTAGSQHNNGITYIQTADQASNALEPLVHSFPSLCLSKYERRQSLVSVKCTAFWRSHTGRTGRVKYLIKATTRFGVACRNYA